MVLAFVIDCLDLSNGTSMSAYRFVEQFRKAGHEVRLVSIGAGGENAYPLEPRRIPLVSYVAKKQHIQFAKPDRKILMRAFRGADIVHFYFPWKLAFKGRKICREMNIPCTTAFHVSPENITSNIGMSKTSFVNNLFYWYPRSYYNSIKHIHCPSQLIADLLVQSKYKSKLHVISNGVDEDFCPAKTPVKYKDDKFHIGIIGRFAPEKRHDLTIKAVNASKYREQIQLHFFGCGPKQKKLEKLSKILPNQPVFGFLKKADLINEIRKMDLYVHASDVEAESIACIEAISCGLVPVIAKSPRSAAKQFALDDRSLFPTGNASALTARIEYWIENSGERERMKGAYAEKGKSYNIKESIRLTEEMFREAIADHNR